MPTRLIKAFYAGKCRICGKAVHKGDTAWFAKHFGFRCETCGPHTGQDQRLSPKSSKAPPSPPPATPKASPAATEPVQPFRSTGFEPSYAPASAKGPMYRGADNVCRLSYACVSELVSDATDDYGQSEKTREYIRERQSIHAGDTWANGHTVATLARAVGNPKSELVRAVDEMRRELIGELSLPSTRRRVIRRGRDSGDELDADRYLNRIPEAWERIEREKVERHNATIGVNLSVWWKQTPEELLYRGAAALALADILTERGVNVRIVGFSVGEAASNTMDRFVGILELKAMEMPMDAAGLATAVCDIGFYRMGMLFAQFRHVTGRASKSMGVYGASLPGPDRKQLDYVAENSITSRPLAVEWLRSQLAERSAKE